VEQAHQYSVRIELRGVSAEGAAQVVSKGVWGAARKTVVECSVKN